jgi:hypothetical protein
MSYFATVSGAILDGERVDTLTLVPADQAQDYVRERISDIASFDGEPVYFCDDNATGTSDDFIGSAIEYAAEHGTLDGHPMLQLLKLCERTKAVLRIWYPREKATDFQRAVSCSGAMEASRLMVKQLYSGHWYFRVAP